MHIYILAAVSSQKPKIINHLNFHTLPLTNGSN